MAKFTICKVDKMCTTFFASHTARILRTNQGEVVANVFA